MEYFELLRTKLRTLCDEHNFLTQPIDITARALSAEEAIGKPEKKDFPLLKGKEVMIKARFLDGHGEGYTSVPGAFTGTIQDILQLPLTDDLERACFIAALNAVMHHIGLVKKTVHCRDKDPEICASQLTQYVSEQFGTPRIAFFGFQPAMINALAKQFSIRVVDLDKDNIGKTKYNVKIQGPEATEKNIAWADLILATGSTAINGTISRFFGDKPTIFYGVTIAGAAELLGCQRYCPCSY